MARPPAAIVLQLSHHGRTGHVLRTDHGDRSLSALARQVIPDALGAMAAFVELSASLHRQYRRLDDGRNGTPAMGGLWFDSHLPGLQQIYLQRQWSINPDRFHGTVHRFLYS